MLRCPAPHREEYLVLSTGEMSGRMVRRGVIGCPVCHREFEIVDGVVEFGGAASGDQGAEPSVAAAPASPLPAPDVLQALLDLTGPGGLIVLLGSAARSAEGLASLIAGVHLVGINAPPDLGVSPVLSLLRTDRGVPLRRAVARGVVVGAEVATPAWLEEAARLLLPGRRLVVAAETPAPPGVTRLAIGYGVWVGEKATGGPTRPPVASSP